MQLLHKHIVLSVKILFWMRTESEGGGIFFPNVPLKSVHDAVNCQS